MANSSTGAKVGLGRSSGPCPAAPRLPFAFCSGMISGFSCDRIWVISRKVPVSPLQAMSVPHIPAALRRYMPPGPMKGE